MQHIDISPDQVVEVPDLVRNGSMTGLPHRLPNLRVLAQDFYERQYGEYECWRLVYDLLQAGGFLEVGADVQDAVRSVQEVWFQDDRRDPLMVVQPWDWLLLHSSRIAGQNICLVVDPMDMIHLHRHAGVRIEPMRRYRHQLIQVARLRCLM
jgi:hypothetical protein